MDNPTYLIYKTKFNINNPYTPVDIHPIQPWLLYCDSENNIIIQNYQNNEKLLHFSISQHDEEKRELLLLQKRIPTLSSINNGSQQNSPNSTSINYVGGIGNTGSQTNPQSGSQQQTGTTSTSTSTTSTANTGNVNSPNVPTIQTHSANQTLHRNQLNNTLRPSQNNESTSTQQQQLLRDDQLDKIEKLGQIKFLYFYDRFTKSYRDRKPKISQNKNKIGNNGISSSVGIEDNIVVVAENRIVLINYHSHKLREIKIPTFDTKAPSCVEFFSNLPIIAFGGPDSVIRLWNTDKWELEKQLTGGHPKGGIVKLKSIEVESELLASTGTDGYCCIWNMKTGTLLHQFAKTGHEFLDLSYDHVTGYLLGLTDDKMIYTYDPVTLKELSKISCGKKESYQSIESYYHPRLGGLDIMLTTKSPAMISFFNRMAPTTTSTSSSDSKVQVTNSSYSIDIDVLLGTSKKEKSKLYKVLQHPLNPTQLVCWINKSIYILSMSQTATPISSTMKFNATLNDSVVFYPYQGFICQSALTNLLSTTNERTKTPIQVTPSDNIKLEVSPSGKYLSLMSISTQQYQIFEISSWKLIEKGTALDLAWSHQNEKGIEKFGKLEKIFESVDTIKKKKTLGILPSVGRSSKKEEQVFSKILLQTKEIQTNITQELLLNTNQDRLLGGLLLGVYQKNYDSSALLNQTPTTTSPTSLTSSGSSSSSSLSSATSTPSSSNLLSNVSSSSISSSTSTSTTNLTNSNSTTTTGGTSPSSINSLNTAGLEIAINTKGEEVEFSSIQLLDWWSLAPVHQIQPPLKIYWNDLQTLCAIVYTNRFYVFGVRDGINAICMYPLEVISAIWRNNSLFFATPNDIQCIFPHRNESTPLILASNTGVVFPEDLYDINQQQPTFKPNQTFTTLPNYKPSGPVSLVDVNNEGLIYLDSNYKFYCIPLSSALLKFFLLAQMESYENAMRLTLCIDQKYHYLLAKFLTDRGQARDCINLIGISPFLKFLICVNNECYDASLDIVPSLISALKSHQTIHNEETNEEVTLSYISKTCIEIGKKSQAKSDYACSERAFKLANSIDPFSASQQLALQYFNLEKFQELKELQIQVQNNPIESNLISLFLEQQ